MILIESNYDYLTREVCRELKELDPRLSFHVPDEFDLNVKRLHKLLHADNRFQVRANLVEFTVNNLSQAEAHMVGTALLATGSFVLVVHPPLEEELEDRTARFYSCTMGGLLPGMNIYDRELLSELATRWLELWQGNLEDLAKVYGTDIWSAGGLHSGQVMLVGDRVNPFVPFDEGRRLAFVSHQGCSHFLHQALVANFLAQGTRYYLTNAYKSHVRKANMEMLNEEIQLVKPVKIVALGGVAAQYLSDLGQEFTRTYHPQYWKRFKNKELPELIKLVGL
jgi:hypothetical protein